MANDELLLHAQRHFRIGANAWIATNITCLTAFETVRKADEKIIGAFKSAQIRHAAAMLKRPEKSRSDVTLVAKMSPQTLTKSRQGCNSSANDELLLHAQGHFRIGVNAWIATNITCLTAFETVRKADEKIIGAFESTPKYHTPERY